MSDIRPSGLRVYVEREPFDAFRTKVLIAEYRDGRRWVARPVEMVEKPQGEAIEPTLWLEDVAAQSLIDALWAAGFRPTAGHGSAGQLAATEKHLSDMQRIAFHLLARNGEKP